MSWLRAVVLALACLILTTGFGITKAQAADSRSELSSHIKEYLSAKGSPLAPYSDEFVEWGVHYGVDPKLLVAIAGGETYFAMAPAAAPASTVGHNAWGIGPGWHFRSWPHGIKSAAELLGNYYRHKKTIAGIRYKWAPPKVANDPNGLNEHWIKNVSKYYVEIGGDPSANVFMTPGGKLPKEKSPPKPDKEAKPDGKPGRSSGLQMDIVAPSRGSDGAVFEDRTISFASIVKWMLVGMCLLGAAAAVVQRSTE